MCSVLSGNPELDRQLLRAYFDSANDGILVLCDEMKFLLCNRAVESWLGESEGELTGHGRRISITRFFLDNDDARAFVSAFRSALAGIPGKIECRLQPSRGVPRWIELSLSRVRIKGGEMVIGVARDIGAAKQSQALMGRLTSAVEQTADSVVITDRAGVIEYVNPAFERTTGFRADEAFGQTPRIVRSGMHDEGFYRTLWETILRGKVFRAVFTNRRKDGGIYYEEKTITPLRDARGDITHFVSTGKNVTERIRAQERLDYLAHYDPVTGLPNRNLLNDRLAHALRRLDHGPGRIAVMFIDLDNFKTVNDSLGHDVGDRLLKGVAETLSGAVREADTVARAGGDEFVVVLEDIGEADPVARVAQKILDALALRPFRLDETEISLTASIGIALAPSHGTSVDHLLKHADTAMYRAKERGRNAYRFYAAEMTARVHEHLALHTSLAKASQRGEFELYYQPQVSLKTGRVEAVEALLRWHHPDRGLVMPDQFIPVLEESGLILNVGEWVLQTVCGHIQALQGALGYSMRVAVNVSPRQFSDPDFVENVRCMRCLVRGEGACADVPEFEITENVLLGDDQATLDVLKRLRAGGVRLAIDDFGVGHSSFAYLAGFPVDTIKIDRYFMRDLMHNDTVAQLVQAMIAMAHALGATVVAEGVETTEQRDLLARFGCDAVQGYVYSLPMPLNALIRMLQGGAGTIQGPPSILPTDCGP